ncbi:MAG: M16 family metallopeptidase [Vicinamibacterales bacterium]
MDIPYTSRTLANGLDVIVHVDRHVPMAAVSVWYHVGSRHEQPGRTGFAHLFEHLMFKGSEHHPQGYFEALQDAGGLVNGSTNADRTNYWEVVPSPALELALWMESDRMGYLLPALDHAKFATERDVVLNERRQNYENRPYGLSSFALSSALYPPDHPYAWPTIGMPADLLASSVDDVRAFFRSYYHPANASLAIAGDVDPDEALELAERYFGEIPAGPPVAHPARGAVLDAPARVWLGDRVELPRLTLAWHTPAMFEEDDAALDIASDILANGKTARLYRALVHERRLAADVSAAQASREMSSLFYVAATAAPGQPLQAIESEVARVLDDLATSGPTADEFERATARAEAHFVYHLQTIGGFGGKSDQLNAYNVLAKTPGYMASDRARYARATPASVAAAVRRWLRDAPGAALSVVPAESPERALPGSTRVHPQ